MYCPHCGKQLPDGAKFCGFCGGNTGGMPESDVGLGNGNAPGSDAGLGNGNTPGSDAGYGSRNVSGSGKGFGNGSAAETPETAAASAARGGAPKILPVLITAAAVVVVVGAAVLFSSGGSGSGTAAASGDGAQTSAAASDEGTEAAGTAVEYDPYDLEDLDLSVWDGTTTESYAGGDGSKSDPYQISNGAELDLFMNSGKHDGEYFVLTADIQMNELNDWESWTDTPPENISSGAGGFSGTLDGQYHTIYGLYTERGLIDSAGDGGVIKNLTLTACVSYSEDDCAGGIVGEIGSGESVQVENCVFNGIVFGTRAGGIIGSASLKYVDGGLVIKSCKVRGTITSTKENENCGAGGIIGVLTTDDPDASATISYCTNHSEVSGYHAGGIAAKVSVDSDVYTSGSFIKVYDCGNTGEISSLDGGYAGGIIGDATAKCAYLTVTSCFNSGDIGGEGGSKGILGNGLTFTNGSITLSSCYYCGSSTGYKEEYTVYAGTFEAYVEKMSEEELEEAGYVTDDEAKLAVEKGDCLQAGGKLVYTDSFDNVYVSEKNGSREVLITHLSGQAYDFDYYDTYQDWVGYTAAGDSVFYTVYDDSVSAVRIVRLNLETMEETTLAQDDDYQIYLVGSADGKVFYVVPTEGTDYDRHTEYLDVDTGDSGVLADEAVLYMGEGYLISSVYAQEGTTYTFYDTDGTVLCSVVSDNAAYINGEFLVIQDEAICSVDPLTDTWNVICGYTGEGDLYDADEDYIYVTVMLDEIIYEEDGSFYDAEVYRISRGTGDVELYGTMFFS